MEGKKGAHEWMIEFKSSCRCITIAIPESDYEAKRNNNMTLNPLIIT
jgi:hypothetical protein